MPTAMRCRPTDPPPTRFLGGLLLGAALLSACQASAPSGGDGLRFPAPDRPVAPIVSATYADEEARDANREAERVMDRLGVAPGVRVADVGAGDGYYTVRLARRLGVGATFYAQDVERPHLKRLEERLAREKIDGVTLVLGAPRDPKLPPVSVDVTILSHMYHEIENPFEFLYRLWPALAPNARIGIIDAARPTRDHGTPPALLRCELAAVGYRQLDFMWVEGAEVYLAVFVPPNALPAADSIRPCTE